MIDRFQVKGHFWDEFEVGTERLLMIVRRTGGRTECNLAQTVQVFLPQHADLTFMLKRSRLVEYRTPSRATAVRRLGSCKYNKKYVSNITVRRDSRSENLS